MIEKYQQFFQLDVFHTYFQKEICRCLAFNADVETERLMKRFRFIIRRKINGIGLYGNAAQEPAQLFNYIKQATGLTAFCFEIRTNNPDFNFFTEVPSNWVGQFLYDSNHNSAEADTVNLTPQLAGNAGTLCFGKVTLRFADILKFSTSTGFANFVIQYKARATQWQYYIVNTHKTSFQNLRIIGKEPIDFEGPENVTIATGQEALLFSSGSNLIPLSEEPIHKFDLVNWPSSAENAATAPQLIIKGLPTPIPEWIGRITGKANEQLSSPMYVYL